MKASRKPFERLGKFEKGRHVFFGYPDEHVPPLLGKFEKGRHVFIGIPEGDEIVETSASCLMDVIQDGASESAKRHRASSLRVLAPVDKPSKKYRSQPAQSPCT